MFLQILVIIGMAIFAGILGWWTIDRAPPTNLQAQRVIEDEAQTPGGRLLIEYTTHRYKVCSVVLEQVLFDSRGIRYILPEQEYTVEPGTNGAETFVLPVPIPDKFSAGPARFRAFRTYACNPIQRWFWPVVLRSPDIEFDVKDKR
jgi:hypothetical protein